MNGKETFLQEFCRHNQITCENRKFDVESMNQALDPRPKSWEYPCFKEQTTQALLNAGFAWPEENWGF